MTSTPSTRTPPRRALRQRLWNAMRIKQIFTYDDLQILAQADEESGRFRTSLYTYLDALRLAGYVVEAPHTSGGATQWRLARNTGPLAPSWTAKSRTLHDHNTQTTQSVGLRPGSRPRSRGASLAADHGALPR